MFEKAEGASAGEAWTFCKYTLFDTEELTAGDMISILGDAREKGYDG